MFTCTSIPPKDDLFILVQPNYKFDALGVARPDYVFAKTAAKVIYAKPQKDIVYVVLKP